MDQRAILIASFGVGVALQVAVLLRRDWSWWKLAACVAVGCIAMFPARKESHYEPLFHMLMGLSFFSFVFAIAFRRDVLPTITKTTVLYYSLIFWFAFFSYFYSGSRLQNELLICLLLPTAATVVAAFRNAQLAFPLKLILYTWFLCVIVCVGLFQFPFSQLNLFYTDRQVPWTTPLESLAAGMAFLFLAANATYIWYLIPIPGRSQSFASRMKEWHEFTDLMTQRFDDHVDVQRQTWVLLLSAEAVLLLNFIFQWLPPAPLINTLVVLPGILFAARALTGGSAARVQHAGDPPTASAGVSPISRERPEPVRRR